MDKKIINIYGDDYDQVYTVACRIRNLTTIQIVEKPADANPMGIIIGEHRNAWVDTKCFNHCVDTNDEINDKYVIGVWMKANTFFFET